MKNECPQCGEPVVEGEDCPVCLMAVVMEPTEGFGEAEEDAAPPTIPGIDIQEELGRGGMGRVYRAVQTRLGRTVAVKVMSRKLCSDPHYTERFKREARVLASLDHPGIVRVHDHGVADGQTYLVMELVEGTNLRRLMQTGLESPQALAIVPQICDALAYAHDQGAVHRDIKPENILVDLQGRVKIVDFGLARLSRTNEAALTQSQQVMGTLHYMAPEQHAGLGHADHRADIYSLGVVFYEMLTGDLPIGRFDPPSQRVQVDVRLDEIVLKALENEPSRRYQDATDVKVAVEAVESGTAAGPRDMAGLRHAIIITIVVTVLGYLALKQLVLPLVGPVVVETFGWGDTEGGKSVADEVSFRGPQALAERIAGNLGYMVAFLLTVFLVMAAMALLWLWMLIDCLLRDFRLAPIFTARGDQDKVIWLVLLFLLNVPAAILYWLTVKRRFPREVRT